jgi:excisionase family DNA binding protein
VSEAGPAILNIAEAAAFLRLSERKLYGLVAEERVPFVRLDGRLLFPRHLLDAWLEGQASGPTVRAAPPVVAGSHDPLLEWSLRESGCSLAMLINGSGEGLACLVRGEVVAAGLHLREPAGSYNIAAAKGSGLRDIVLTHWARRREVLLLGKRAQSLKELGEVARHRLRLARRQPAAGAQILAEQLLRDAGVDPGTVLWTEHIYRTHDEVATAIQDGAADAGVALEGLGRRFRLRFEPLAWEEFDLAMRRRDYFEQPCQALLAFTRTAPFHARASEIGGYDTAQTGRVRFNA